MTPRFSTSEKSPVAPADRPTATGAPPEVLNFEGLCNRCMGNIDLVQRVLDGFQQRLPEELAELERLLELKDTEQIARVAHRLKGTSANVSADGLQRVAAEIEDLSRTGRVTEIPNRIERLRGEWEKYRSYASTLFPASMPDNKAERPPTTAQR